MKCQSTIEFGDDHGDNTATFHCRLKHGHDGPHQEKGDMGNPAKLKIPYTLTWDGSAADLKAIYDRECEELQAKCPHTSRSSSRLYRFSWCNDCGKEFDSQKEEA